MHMVLTTENIITITQNHSLNSKRKVKTPQCYNSKLIVHIICFS